MSGDHLRIGVLAAARITELSLIGPAKATGDRLVAVAARDGPGGRGRLQPARELGDTIEVTGPDGTRVEELGRRSSYTYQLEALAAHLRDGTPLLTDANDAVANMELVDEVSRTAGLFPRPPQRTGGMAER